MGKLILYGLDASPPVRACLLTLKALELPFEYIIVNLLQGEQLSEAFMQKNPQHTVPTLEDDGQILWDSHAIMAYLVSKYGKDDSLYPTDLLKRAVVDQRLHFESGVVFTGSVRRNVGPLLYKNQTEVAQAQIDEIAIVYEFLEKFLEDGDYIAGDHLTIADFSIVTSISSIIVFLEVDPSKYPKLAAWMSRLEELPFYVEANGNGAKMLRDMVKSKNFTIVS